MKHHYIVVSVMPDDYLCPMGVICTKEELGAYLKSQGAKSYKIKVVDNEPVPDWESGEWIGV